MLQYKLQNFRTGDETMTDNRPIGVFDSGIGGLSTLKTMATILPNESFIFLGDSKNAPYGDKEKDQILQFSRNNVEFLLNKGVKAIVIACNTATSAAKTELMAEYNVPIIGIEPALKPAVEAGNQDILVLGTALTMKLTKFQAQYHRFEDQTQIDLKPLPGLVDIIETGVVSGPAIKDFLADNLSEFNANQIDGVVLGCTHYPFVRNSIQEFFPNANFYDGFLGVTKMLKHKLNEGNLNTDNQEKGQISFYSTEDTPEEIDRYQKLFNQYQVSDADLPTTGTLE
ncbi:glutamate racemase [Lactobacillus senioris]|uniref:Glutamate racemase n=2 Tax=Lentilactobacillus senioris TaxID=931534 RepID=A0A0R2D444_9LACO|nr:glutamate racemase [Lentilactobacillus senioris DSM 24302 = JCM 17472]